MPKEIQVGALVVYKCSSTGKFISGLIADVFEDDNLDVSPYPMYEVISTDPPDRVWLAEYEMSVINNCRNS